MDEQYLIDIITLQKIDGEWEDSRLTTSAALEQKENGYVITYKQEDEDFSISTTEITYENGCITVLRTSPSITTHFILEENIRHVSNHETPYGSFSMGINADEIRSTVAEDGGVLSFRYKTDINFSPLSEMSFHISLKKKSKG